MIGPASAPERNAAPCELLPWDSAHFGLTIARVCGGRLNAAEAAAIDCWCLDEGVRCLYFLADSDHPETLRAAATCGFRVVDVRVTLAHGLEGLGEHPWAAPGPVSVREASEKDLPTLRALAARSHRSTRFYSDGGFPSERCDELYARWVERGVRDPDYTVLVPQLGQALAGYHVIRMSTGGTGHLDLIAIAEDESRRGIGGALLLSALRFLADRGAVRAVTATQSSNVASIRLHERAGFGIQRSQLWYHKWYSEPAIGRRVRLSSAPSPEASPP